MVNKLQSLQVDKIRSDFPILNRLVNGKKLVYFDNAATTQKPQVVIDALNNYYKNHNANVHRGIHKLSEEATLSYEEARKNIAKFINAKSWREIIFVRNSTEAINLVMYSWALENLEKGDRVISTVMEHHSNIVPWQFLQRKGVELSFIDIDDEGKLRLDQYDKLVNKAKLVTVTNTSNVLGTINPAKEIAKIAHENGSLILVDGAQSVPHMNADVKDMDCDFLVFSGHKMLAPTGVGVLYAKQEILEKMRPFLYGGEMIKEVHLHETKFNELPWKFEAGTPNIAGVIAFSAAIDYLNRIGMDRIREHEKELISYALEKISEVKDVKVFGPRDPEIRSGVLSFNLADIHSHDVAALLDEFGIAIRSGHHCAMPLMKRLGVSSVARASFYLYNTLEEIDYFVKALEELRKVFRL